jgi:hypothetical protein
MASDTMEQLEIARSDITDALADADAFDDGGILYLRGFMHGFQMRLDDIMATLTAERARWRAVAQAAERVAHEWQSATRPVSSAMGRAMDELVTALAALPPAGKGRP